MVRNIFGDTFVVFGGAIVTTSAVCMHELVKVISTSVERWLEVKLALIAIGTNVQERFVCVATRAEAVCRFSVTKGVMRGAFAPPVTRGT